jgi:hypothetical protein
MVDGIRVDAVARPDQTQPLTPAASQNTTQSRGRRDDLDDEIPF